MAHEHLHFKEDITGAHTHGKQVRVSMALIGTLAGGMLMLTWIVARSRFLYGSDSFQVELLAMVAALLLGAPIVLHAIKSIIKREMHMDELVALAIIAAFATGKYVEAGIVAFFMLLSELIETRTALGARASIESLIKLTPTRANLIDSDGSEREVKVSNLKPGDFIRARPGDNIPADGEVVNGLSKWYTPTILMIAGIVLFFTRDIDRAIVILVVSCPCALILATPTAMVAAISASARLGILIKNVADLEVAGKMTAMVFDKTGTVTTGRLYVTKLTPAEGVEPADLLAVAASAEQMSKHPAARALREVAKEANLSLPATENFQETPGKGVTALVDKSTIYVGRDTFLKENNVDISNVSDPALHEEQGFSTLYVAKDSKCMGWIGLQDKTRPEAREAVRELLDIGIKRITMLTGDRKEVAGRVAAELNCTDFKAHCLPQDKLAIVEQIRKDGHTVVVVGDGINDAPALAAGDLGIAMGAAGSDVAINSASIALMSDDLKRLPFLVRLSRKTRSVITQNLGFGILFVILGDTAGAAGWLPAVYAAVLHFAGSLIVVFNSARLVRYGEELDHEL